MAILWMEIVPEQIWMDSVRYQICIKRKIRNRLQDMGEDIFVQTDDRCMDGCKSLSERARITPELEAALKSKNSDSYIKAVCDKWIDVRSFGQVFAFKDNNVSIGVRGPVSIHPAFSISPIEIVERQITKSTNSEPSKDGKRTSDTMGTKYRVEFGLYLFKGSINHQLADRTGFSDADADKIKEAEHYLKMIVLLPDRMEAWRWSEYIGGDITVLQDNILRRKYIIHWK